MEIKEFFIELKENYAYLIPVALFTVVSFFHVAGHWDIAAIAAAQIVFFIWAAVIAWRRELMLWPVAALGIVLLLVNSGSSLYREYSLKGVTEAIAADDTISARELLESVDSEETVKSKLYLHLQDLVNTRIEQQESELAVKARGELKGDNLDEAKRTVAMILDLNSDNNAAASMAEIIKGREIAATEKHLTPEALAGVKALRKKVYLFIAKKKYSDARNSIDDFLKVDSDINKENILITSLLEQVDEKEKGTELIKQKQLNYKKTNEALSLYRKKEYGESVDLLEEVLSSDSKNRAAQNLLKKARKKLEKQRYDFWSDVILWGLLIAGAVIYIRRRW
ncbi:MAG TPA: hypothetical protein PK293_12640 [Spirochaetota bacterium]|nr:hypothetical protein [Spirochaetota bacterium]